MTVLAPADEAGRLQALRRYEILDTPPEPDFDAITRLAAQICDMPIAIINFIEGERQWFKSAVGFDLHETSRDISICVHALPLDEVLVISDASSDPRVANNPLVRAVDGVRFYAGVRLETPDGHAIGTLCVLDRRERALTPEQIDALRALGRQVMTLLELRRAIREQGRADALLQERNDLLQDQNAILGMIADGTGFQPVLDRIAMAVERATHPARCSILLLDRENRLRHAAAPSLPEAYTSAIDGVAIGPVAGSCGAAAFRRETVITSDIAEDPLWAEYRDLALPHGLRACWSQPILAPGGEVLGTFGLYYPEPREPDAAELELMRSMAGLVRITVEQGRRDEALREEARVLDALNRIGQSIAAELDLQRLTQKITDAATEISGAQFGALFYNARDERGEYYSLYTLSGVPRESFSRFPMPRKTQVFEPTFLGQGIVRSDDITRDPRYGHNPPYQGMPEGHLPVRSYLAVPVVSRSGEVLGGLFFGHSEPGVFGERAERIVAGIAAQAAIAIDNAHLFQQAEREIAARAAAETALRESERRYRFLADSIPQFVFTATADGAVDYINARWEEYCRIPVEDGLGWNWGGVIHPDDRDRVTERWLESVRTGAMFTCEFRLRRHDGVYRWFLSRALPFHGDDGRIERWFGTATDIEDTKRTEQRLRDSERRYRTLIDTLPQLVWTARPDGEADFLSTQWCDYTGQPMETQLGSGWAEALHPDDRERAYLAWRDAIEGRAVYDLEFRIRRHDGEYRWFKTRGVPLRDETGRILHWFGSCTDITEITEARETLARSEKRLEAMVRERTRQLEESNMRLLQEMEERGRAEHALRHAQKMEAIGKLTGGVAHDFNNLLQVIAGNLQLLRRDIAGNAVAAQRLQNALAGVDRGAKLASQLLAFARRQPLEPQVVNLGRLVQNMGDLLRRALGEAIEVETVIAGGLWNTLADPAQVENAILNLAVNARDAMDGIGRLTIEVGNAYLDDDYAARHEDVQSGQYVMIAVTDTGSGMAPDVLQRVFEPFFTTKPEGQGTGLGLPMVYGFVKQSGGHIKLYSEPGEGTTVKIYLPRDRRAETVVVERPSGPVTGGSETILVVEDDADVRTTVVEMLKELGYRVLQAEDGQSALAIVKSGMPINLLFTDVVMPGPLRSPDLARQARAAQPDIAVLFTSGYTENAIVHGGRLDEGVHLLSKPYRREELARKVRQLLDERKEAAGAAPSEPVRLRILFVEDEVLIRELTADILRDLGHEVHVAGDAEQAFAILERGGIDVLFTDVGLPGMSGEDLAHEAVRRDPSLKVVLATGAGSAVIRGGNLAGFALLPKPYQPEDVQALLTSMVREKTDGGAGA